FYHHPQHFPQHHPPQEIYPPTQNQPFLQLSNLLFTHFNHNKHHTYTPLPNKNIHTRIPLQTIPSLPQNLPTNYQTHLFIPIIHELEKLSPKAYFENHNYDLPFKM
ncbi:alanine--tRNA ligase-related protein, partial [Staphylococcus saprophyticus]|uniref:alanine--tRNA ligase-related protein n=1 Tax=Staphylococcus saprophyticus TaxID=29385 RepID=UPI003703770E